MSQWVSKNVQKFASFFDSFFDNFFGCSCSDGFSSFVCFDFVVVVIPVVADVHQAFAAGFHGDVGTNCRTVTWLEKQERLRTVSLGPLVGSQRSQKNFVS